MPDESGWNPPGWFWWLLLPCAAALWLWLLGVVGLLAPLLGRMW